MVSSGIFGSKLHPLYSAGRGNDTDFPNFFKQRVVNNLPISKEHMCDLSEVGKWGFICLLQTCHLSEVIGITDLGEVKCL